jgi:hypothetical protein
MSYYIDSSIFFILLVILEILLVIFIILSDIIEISLSDSYNLYRTIMWEEVWP